MQNAFKCNFARVTLLAQFEQAQVLFAVLRSAIVNVVPVENICSDAEPLFAQVSTRASNLRSGPL